MREESAEGDCNPHGGTAQHARGFRVRAYLSRTRTPSECAHAFMVAEAF
jgi:hypothetical protein